MKIYVECKSCGEKIYFDESYERPSEYPKSITLECSNGHIHTYYRNDLQAEKSGSATAAGALFGGIVGSIGGPAGVAVGAGIGGALGANQDQQEEERVNRFNELARRF